MREPKDNPPLSSGPSSSYFCTSKMSFVLGLSFCREENDRPVGISFSSLQQLERRADEKGWAFKNFVP